MKRPSPTSSSTPSDSVTVVAEYAATVSLITIQSGFSPRLPLGASIVDSLSKPPGFAPWPPAPLASRQLSSTPSDQTLLLLCRLKLIFDFGAQIEGESSEELAKAIDLRWPAIAKLRAAMETGQASETYAQAAVTADVDSSGDSRWGYTSNVNGGEPLPLTYVAEDGKRTEFDRFLQNLVRLDLQKRIETLL